MERNHEGSPRKGRVMDQSFLKAGGGRKGFCSHLSSGEWCPPRVLSLEQGTACGGGGGGWLMQWGSEERSQKVMVTGIPKSEFLDHSRPTLPESVWLVLPSQGRALGLGASPGSLSPRETWTSGLDGKLQAGLVLKLGKRRQSPEASPGGRQPLHSGEGAQGQHLSQPGVTFRGTGPASPSPASGAARGVSPAG